MSTTPFAPEVGDQVLINPHGGISAYERACLGLVLRVTATQYVVEVPGRRKAMRFNRKYLSQVGDPNTPSRLVDPESVEGRLALLRSKVFSARSDIAFASHFPRIYETEEVLAYSARALKAATALHEAATALHEFEAEQIAAKAARVES